MSDQRFSRRATARRGRAGEDALARANGPAEMVTDAVKHRQKSQADPGSVLVVEDDSDAREMLAIALASAGFEVRTAHDGKAGLEAAAAGPVDLIITDVAMPRMDGIQMVQQLRGMTETRDIPIIVVTGQAVADIPVKAGAAGCTALLSKPCCPDYLVSIVTEYIGGRGNRGASGLKTKGGGSRRRGR